MKSFKSRKHKFCKAGCNIHIGFMCYPQRHGVLCKECFDKRVNSRVDRDKQVKFILLISVIIFILTCL